MRLSVLSRPRRLTAHHITHLSQSIRLVVNAVKSCGFFVRHLRLDKFLALLSSVEKIDHFLLEERLEIRVILGDIEKVNEAIKRDNILSLGLQVHKLVVAGISVLHGFSCCVNHLIDESTLGRKICAKVSFHLRQLVFCLWQVILELLGHIYASAKNIYNSSIQLMI